MEQKKFRNAVFTSYLEDLLPDMDLVRYIVHGHEVCPTTGRHLQGYVEFSRQLLLRRAQNALGDEGCHLEPREASADRAINYCKKDGFYVEKGERANPGRRTDLEAVTDLVREGANIADIAHEKPEKFIRFATGISKPVMYRDIRLARDIRTREVHVTVLVGHASTGKTYWCNTQPRDEGFYIVPMAQWDKLWWDGYEGQKTIFFDDFSHGVCSFDDVKRYLDCYQVWLPQKNGGCNAQFNTVYITSTEWPSTWYKCTNFRRDPVQLYRRITALYKVEQREFQFVFDKSYSEQFDC